jgi:hypothetical protein
MSSWPSLIVMVPTSFCHLRRFSASTLALLMSGSRRVDWSQQQFTKVSGNEPIVSLRLDFGWIVGKGE